MTIKELLVLFKFDVDDASFAYAHSMLNKIEEKASGLEQQSSKDDYFGGVGKGADKASLGVNALLGRMKMLAGLAGISLTINGLIQTADQWRTIEGQVKNVIGEEENLEDIQERLYQVAGRTRQSYAQTAGLFTSVSRSASELGKSTDEILAFTEDVAMALRAGGGNADSQAAALVQLGQALGSGALRGDELNSILEQAPVLANTIAQGMGTSIGQLRRLGREGKITSAIIFDSVRKMHNDLVRQTANAPLTMNAAFLRVRDSVGRLVFKLEKGFGVVNMIAESVAKVADLIDLIKIDERTIAAMKLLAIWATVFWLATSKSVKGKYDELLNTLGKLREGYKSLSVVQAGFSLTSIKAVLAANAPYLILAAKILGIITLITALIAIVQDLYIWINGGDSVFGDFFGTWEEACAKVKKTWEEVREAFAYAIDTPLGDLIKDLIKWLEDLQAKVGAFDIQGKVKGWWDENVHNPFNEMLDGLVKGSMHEGPQLSAAQVEAYRVVADRGGNQNITTNSGNVTTNIQVTAPNGSAEAIAGAVEKVVPSNPSYDFAMN